MAAICSASTTRPSSDYPRHPTATDERHRLIATGIVGGAVERHPQHVDHARLGHAYTIDDQSLGGGVNERRLLRNGAPPEQFDFIIPNAWAYRSVDLRAEKQFAVGGAAAASASPSKASTCFQLDNFG